MFDSRFEVPWGFKLLVLDLSHKMDFGAAIHPHARADFVRQWTVGAPELPCAFLWTAADARPILVPQRSVTRSGLFEFVTRHLGAQGAPKARAEGFEVPAKVEQLSGSSLSNVRLAI